MMKREVTHTTNNRNSYSAVQQLQPVQPESTQWDGGKKKSLFIPSKSYTSCFSKKILILPYSQTNIHIVRKFPMMHTYMYIGYLYGIPTMFVLDDFFVNTVPKCSLLLFCRPKNFVVEPSHLVLFHPWFSKAAFQFFSHT